jgi:hypothetical protein
VISAVGDLLISRRMENSTLSPNLSLTGKQKALFIVPCLSGALFFLLISNSSEIHFWKWDSVSTYRICHFLSGAMLLVGCAGCCIGSLLLFAGKKTGFSIVLNGSILYFGILLSVILMNLKYFDWTRQHNSFDLLLLFVLVVVMTYHGILAIWLLKKREYFNVEKKKVIITVILSLVLAGIAVGAEIVTKILYNYTMDV